MLNQKLRDRFRHQLTNAHALTVLTVSLFEIIGYIILVMSNVEIFSVTNRYLWYNVVFPITANLITHGVVRTFMNNPAVNRKRKNKAIIIAALVTSFIVAVVHKEYTVTSCAFIFPIVLSAIFSDRKLLNMSFGFSFFILLEVGVAFWIDKVFNLTTSINLFILFGFSLISYLCGIISINFTEQAYATIEEQSAQNDKLRQDVMRDQMTGLYNHNHFEVQLNSQIESYTPDEPLCLVMVDVDDFKKINDTYGHDSGDDVLIYLAQTLQKYCADDKDVAYRYGGEEFAAIFTGKAVGEVSKIMENMLDEFRKHTFEFTDKSITFSAGLAQYSAGVSSDDFFEKADQTLYKAKRTGKNRIMTA